MTRVSRLANEVWRRTRLAYRLRCAREDMKRLRLTAPAGIWQCAHCEHVSLTRGLFWSHFRLVHI